MKKTLALVSCVVLAGCAGKYDAGNFTQREWAKKSFNENYAYCRHEAVKRSYAKANRPWQYGYDDVVDDDLFVACMDKAGYTYKSSFWPTWMVYEQPKGHPQSPGGQALIADGVVMPTKKPVKTPEPDKSALYR